jgi:hypothetical protein
VKRRSAYYKPTPTFEWWVLVFIFRLFFPVWTLQACQSLQRFLHLDDDQLLDLEPKNKPPEHTIMININLGRRVSSQADPNERFS